MARHIIPTIVIILITICLNSYSQNLKIEELAISYYDLSENYDPFNEDHWSGPVIAVKCVINNNSCTEINLNSERDSIIISYNYNMNTYNIPLFCGFNSMQLKKGEFLRFKSAANIFLGTDIFSTQKKDYRIELMQILPSICLSYFIHSQVTTIESCYIQRVKLNE